MGEGISMAKSDKERMIDGLTETEWFEEYLDFNPNPKTRRKPSTSLAKNLDLKKDRDVMKLVDHMYDHLDNVSKICEYLLKSLDKIKESRSAD